MPIDNPDQLFESLAAFLRESGHKLAVDQVSEELTNGRLVEEKLKTLKEVDIGYFAQGEIGDFRSSQTADFVRRQDYSSTDAVVLLLEAARRAILDPIAMVSEIHSVLKNFGVDGIALDLEHANDQHTLDLVKSGNTEDVRSSAREVDRIAKVVRSE